jgi:hypothetical protein
MPDLYSKKKILLAGLEDVKSMFGLQDVFSPVFSRMSQSHGKLYFV